MKQQQKLCTEMKMVIDRGKRSKLNGVKLNRAKPVKNINKNWQSFLEISPMQKEVPPSYKLQSHGR